MADLARLISRLGCVLAALGCVSPAFAVYQSVSPQRYYYVSRYYSAGDESSFCTAFVNNWLGSTYTATPVNTGLDSSGEVFTQCQATKAGAATQTSANQYANCDNTGGVYLVGGGTMCWKSVSACPAGTVADAKGFCKAPPPPTCPSKTLGASSWGPFSTIPAMGVGYYCMGGCTVQVTIDHVLGNGQGVYYSSGTEVETGGTCTGTPSDPSAPVAPSSDPSKPAPQGPSTQPTGPTDSNACPDGQVPGTVNGATLCYTPSYETSSSSSTTTTPSGPASAPSGTTPGSTSSTTTCSNGTCTTTTTTKDPNGNDTSDTTATEPQTQYCADHPDDSVCKDASSFAGSCSAAFSCNGDAIQCAIAQEQHQRDCQLYDTATDLSNKGTAATVAGDTPGDHPNAPGNVASQTFSFSALIDQSDALGAGQCPADVVVHGLTLPFSSVCGALNMLGNVAVAGCMLIAAMIVFKG